jgi:3-oxoacyl-[acyl-carrier protein] reductase
MAENTKVALVTGGGQGIGICIAKSLIDDGYTVAIADIDKEAATESAARFGSEQTAIPYEIDVADEPAVKRVADGGMTRKMIYVE